MMRGVAVTMRRATRRRLAGERGQSLVEFAVVLPVLIGVVVGIFEFGRAWNVYQVVTNAAREGARAAVVAGGSTTTQDQVRTRVNGYMDNGGLNSAGRTITITGFSGPTGQPVTVTVGYGYQFQFLGPVVGLLGGDAEGVPGAITLSSTAVMRNE